jgi:hypothetical protein
MASHDIAILISRHIILELTLVLYLNLIINIGELRSTFLGSRSYNCKAAGEGIPLKAAQVVLSRLEALPLLKG